MTMIKIHHSRVWVTEQSSVLGSLCAQHQCDGTKRLQLMLVAL